MVYITNKQQREVLDLLEESDKSHSELVEKTEYSWEHIQKIIQALRRSDEVAITTDRKYTRKN